MPTTLPLELALQIVDIARFRRLDESAVEHLQRLARIGLACKAFYGVVEHTLATTIFATLSSNPDQSFVDRTLAAERAGKPFETLYLQTEDNVDVGWSLSMMHGRDAVRKVVLLPNPSQGALVFLDLLSSDILPALECLMLSGADLRDPLTRSFGNLRELAVDLEQPRLIRQLLAKSTTPNLRILALQNHGVTDIGEASELFNNNLLARLDCVQLKCRPERFEIEGRLLDGRGDTPILICLDAGNVGYHCRILGNNYRPPYIQLQPLFFPMNGAPVSARRAIKGVFACVKAGCGKKALFLPRTLHPASTCPDPTVDQLRHQLLEAIELAKVEYVSWYHDDLEAKAGISVPFRRYLDRERLEGRM